MNSEFENEGLKASLNLRLTPLRGASGGTCNAYVSRIAGKKVFVKEIKPEFADDARMLAAFRKEAEIGFRLDHRNLPRYIFAEGILPSDRYIVQEFIDGQTLPDFIKENPEYFANKKNLERFIRELTDVIDYLHRNQTVHLDLKPGNVLISRVGNSLKLVDLGFCASDFYDNTRGFTPGELAPEGSLRPEERGMESDYYGIGKILTYIRTHTSGFPKSRFSKLEKGLLVPDPAKRITSKEAIDKCLEGNGGRKRVWVVAMVTFVFVAIGIFFNRGNIQTGQDISADTQAELPADTHPSPDVRIPDTDLTTLDESLPEPAIPTMSAANPPVATTQNRTETGETPAPKQEPAITDNGNFPYDSYAKLKAEMTTNINKNFADFKKMLNTYLRERKFTEKDYKALEAAYRKAISKTFNTAAYKAKYTDLSGSLIDDTMAELLEELEKKDWGSAYNNYIEQYQASVSGSSR